MNIPESTTNKNCAIIVSSFDGYSSVWHPFFTLFFRYWADCPYPIYLITNKKEYSDKRVISTKLGDDNGWSSNLKTVLKDIKEDYIIYFQEDYFLNKKTDTKKINELIKYAKNENVAYLRLKKRYITKIYKNNTNLGVIGINEKYRNSTQTAIWNKNILINLLKDGESGWDFELKNGIERAKEIKEVFLTINYNAINYFSTAIVKGKILYDAMLLCKKENIKLSIDKNKIKKENFLEYLLRKNGVKKFLIKILKKN